MTKIKVSKNGPYIVSGNIPINQEQTIFDSEGIPLKTEVTKKLCDDEEITLCRCGGSDNKPFCDGSHRKNGFNGTENSQNLETDPDDTDTFEGPKLTLKDTPHLCSGAGFCHRDGGVWNLTQNSDDLKSKKTAIEECHYCPSGRLVAIDPKTGKDLEPKISPTIGVDEVGPLCVQGEIPLESVDGHAYPSQTKRSLCRCGKSRNKPFCDGSHFR
jgi:CDGSH-type Zn-finger protein